MNLMRGSKVRVGVRASVAEGSVGERVSDEGLVVAKTHEGGSEELFPSFFWLLGFRGISDPAVAGAINTLASELSSAPPDPSSLDPWPSSLSPRPTLHSALQESESVKYVTLEPASLNVSKTSLLESRYSGIVPTVPTGC